jgi:hypothetical protein
MDISIIWRALSTEGIVTRNDAILPTFVGAPTRNVTFRFGEKRRKKTKTDPRRFVKIGTFLVCLATAGPFSAYLLRLAVLSRHSSLCGCLLSLDFCANIYDWPMSCVCNRCANYFRLEWNSKSVVFVCSTLCAEYVQKKIRLERISENMTNYCSRTFA